MDHLRRELEAQKRIAFTAGLLQGDVTVRTLLQSLAEGVVVANEEGRIVLINKRLGEILGYAQHALIGDPLDRLLPPEMHKEHKGHLQRFFKEPRIRPMGVGFAVDAVRKDGSRVPVEISLSHLNTEVGVLALAFITDVSARQRAEDELKARNEELDAFAHTVAHDLNATLAGMVGFSELLIEADGAYTPEQQLSFLTRIVQNGRKLSGIVNELLLFARIGRTDLELHPLDMQPIVEEAIGRLDFSIQERRARLAVAEPLHTALGYGPWVEEVWFNYISNAVKYGGDPPDIRIGSDLADDGMVRFWVRDRGPGLTAKQQHELFSREGDAQLSAVKGHGLGLSIVDRIVRKLDGRVSVESVPGQGCLFCFFLAAP